jgi:hypothetical protein
MTRLLLLLWLALAASGCSLLTRFDDGTQPCDEGAAPAQQCLAGFRCEAGLCVAAPDGGAADGGQ